LVRQALNYILRGVRIGADRVKITLFLRGAERVHVPTVWLELQCMVLMCGLTCNLSWPEPYVMYVRVGQNHI